MNEETPGFDADESREARQELGQLETRPAGGERKAIHPAIAARHARQEAEKRAAERDAEQIAGQLNRAPPPVELPAQNPANPVGAAPFTRARVPMNVPRRRLAVEPIPGYRLYWHREQDIERAIDAGYEMVQRSEVRVNSRRIGASSLASGNTALGSEVSVVGSAGTGERLILMKIREEYYREDKAAIFEEYAENMRTIFEGEVIMMPDGGAGSPGVVATPDGQLVGAGTTYVKQQRYTPILNRGGKIQPQVTGAKVR